MAQRPRCPYCAKTLEKKPKGKRKCPHCAQSIRVRQGKLLTEEQCDIEDWIKRLEKYGVNQKTFTRHRKQLSRKFGTRASVNDTIWRILNTLVSQTRDYQEQSFIYQEMARLVSMEGKDSKPYIAELLKARLMHFKQDGVIDAVKIKTCNDDLVCQACRSLANKVYSLDAALEQMPIPTLCQSERGCRCWYVGVIENDIDTLIDRLFPDDS